MYSANPTPASETSSLKCYHCGDSVKGMSILSNDKVFCCDGCKMVFELLDQNDLCQYYELDKNPGISAKGKFVSEKYAYLDHEEIKKKLYSFSDGKQSGLTFHLPQMHCSSCIWLLENLHKINSAIITSRVDFPRKEVFILFNESGMSLRKVVELLAFIGYEPQISLNDLEDKKYSYQKTFLYKIGVAGFCFANIMMMSFPEYFSFGELMVSGLKEWFNYLNLALALPVFFYSASEFFISAFKGLRQRFINIDAPIALSILLTFSRSIFEIITNTGSGYFDSMSGIVFFMLIGRYFQNRTYNILSFEHDYTSYFPIGVTVIKNDVRQSVPITSLQKGDRILVRNNEIIPADAILFKGQGFIDYSFVTGESLPVEKTLGEIVYAGGKQTGSAIELEIIKEVSQSYLTQLWNNEAFSKSDNDKDSFIHKLSDYFTVFLLTLALAGFIYWIPSDVGRAFHVLTTVLIVACPCALLLSATFTNGNMLRILGKNKFYLKNANAIERMSKASTIVFDKTGTITHGGHAMIEYQGEALSEEQLAQISALTSQSSHPLSRMLHTYLGAQKNHIVVHYKEHIGKGIEAEVNENRIRLGSCSFANRQKEDISSAFSTIVYVNINEKAIGHFTLKNQYRDGLKRLIASLKKDHRLFLVSGDNDSEKNQLVNLFGTNSNLLFQQSPTDKLNFISRLQQSGERVMMIGDGLNDAGALKKSEIGIAVSEHINNFSPACDGIIDASQLSKLDNFLDYVKSSRKVILFSFFISLLYNAIGISYALSGTLSPVIAAILMPLSSISIILFTTLSSNFLAFKKGLVV